MFLLCPPPEKKTVRVRQFFRKTGLNYVPARKQNIKYVDLETKTLWKFPPLEERPPNTTMHGASQAAAAWRCSANPVFQLPGLYTKLFRCVLQVKTPPMFFSGGSPNPSFFCCFLRLFCMNELWKRFFFWSFGFASNYMPKRRKARTKNVPGQKKTGL